MDQVERSGEPALLQAAIALTKQLDINGICSAVVAVVERLFAARAVWLLLLDALSDELVTVCFDGPGAESYGRARIPSDRGIIGLAFRSHESVFVPDVANEARWFEPHRVQRSGLRSVFAVPLVIDGEAVGVLGLDSPWYSADRTPGRADMDRLEAVGALIAAALRNARQVEQLSAERERMRRMADERRHLPIEVGHLRQEIREARWRNTIIGDSKPFRRTRDQVEVVAPADTSVLLIGETGTGKELIARAIHDHSRRTNRPFIAINCAALPETLVESELFGYEKGAFTGAVGRKIGKFEQAHLGTVFLDEIGDLPAPAQAKLLRVLQEREVQRIGSVRPVTVDVRVIAATNQDLEQAMREGRFRTDLFYRLGVFPIQLPSLRERREDIPQLVSYFVDRFADQLHKTAPQVTPAAMEQLLAYDWPGNVRELQNVVERAVILTKGMTIEPCAIRLGTQMIGRPHPRREDATPSRPEPVFGANVVRFSDAERIAIVRALERTGWRVSGAGGAAEVLGLKPTTLHAKMKKLGIRRPSGIHGPAASTRH